jgi:hypothetical protein
VWSDFADEVIADRMTKEFADVAQLVEQLIRNQQVNGSSPFVGSITSYKISQFTNDAANALAAFLAVGILWGV